MLCAVVSDNSVVFVGGFYVVPPPFFSGKCYIGLKNWIALLPMSINEKIKAILKLKITTAILLQR